MRQHKALWLPVAMVGDAEIWERTPPRILQWDDAGARFIYKRGCVSRSCGWTRDRAIATAEAWQEDEASR